MRASEAEFQMALDNLNKVLPIISKASGTPEISQAVGSLSTEELMYFGAAARVVAMVGVLLDVAAITRPDYASELTRLTQAAKERRAQDPNWKEPEPAVPAVRGFGGIYGRA